MLASSSTVHAFVLTANARIAATSRPSNGVYHIWARRSDGHLVRLELDSDDDAYGIWADQMPLGTPVAMNSVTPGVDGISWTNAGGHEEEHAAYVGQDNRIYDWRLIDGTPSVFQYIALNAPSGQTLTGQVAIGRRLDKIFLFVSTTSGRFYRYVVNDWNTVTYTIEAPVTGVSTTAMISATGPSDGSYVRAFFSKTDNTIWQYKYDGAWTSVSFAGPGTTAGACALSAATEGQIGGTAGYRTYLFCTRTGGTPHDVSLYYKYSSGSGSTVFGAWTSKTVPAGAVGTSGFGLTARRRAEAGANTLEAFLLGSVATNKLFHVEHTANAANLGPSVDSLGWDGETTSRRGGIVAAGRESRGYSDAFFLGQGQSVGLGQSASWLYRRIDDLGGNIPSYKWIQYGSADGWKTYRQGSWANRPNPTESSTAIFGGRVVVVAMYNDSTANGGNRMLWSENEGDTPIGPTTIPTPPQLPNWLDPGPPAPTWNPGGDPTVDFDDSGKAYIVEMRRTKQGDGSDGGRGILVWSTTNGTPSLEMQVFGSSTEIVDHPWVAIYRNPGGADEVHIVWNIEDGGPMRYTHAPVNDLDALTDNIVDVQSGGLDLGIPRITVSQWDGTAYVVWPFGICRIQPDGSCDGLLAFSGNYTPDSADSGSGSELQFPHTSNTFRAVRCFGAVADPGNPNTVYYAFQKREPGVNEGHGPMDLYVTRLDYFAGDIDAGPRIPLTIDEDDGMHQTLPELTVSQDGPTNRMLLATWYDWHNVSCTIGGIGYDGSDWQHSARYEVRMATSDDFGNTWDVIPHSFPTISDPALLPKRQTSGGLATERFLGDYHAVTGDLLHSVHVAITAPVGGFDEVTNIERGWFSHGYWNGVD